LNIQLADRYPQATAHIPQIISLIQTLLSKQVAYTQSGSVYFRVNSFPAYGDLANIDFNAIQSGSGGSGPNERRGERDKESERDFVLWKASGEEEEEEVVWESPFGPGRPGWHIECSAMCRCYLGNTIDIHAGGVDLVFPHHQNEIAQSEAATGEQFSRYWVHNGFVNINNIKMSKSLKNFKTLRDIAQTPFDARAFRFMVVTAQYRAPLNFTPDTLQAARKSLSRIDRVINQLNNILTQLQTNKNIEKIIKKQDSNHQPSELERKAQETLYSFESALCDDLSTPRAIACLFQLISVTEKALKPSNSINISFKDVTAILHSFYRMDSVLGIIYDVPSAYFSSSSPAINDSINESNNKNSNEGIVSSQVLTEVEELAKKRAEMKIQKKYKEADLLRAQIVEKGFEIIDEKDGFKLKPMSK